MQLLDAFFKYFKNQGVIKDEKRKTFAICFIASVTKEIIFLFLFQIKLHFIDINKYSRIIKIK